MILITKGKKELEFVHLHSIELDCKNHKLICLFDKIKLKFPSFFSPSSLILATSIAFPYLKPTYNFFLEPPEDDSAYGF